LAKEFEIITQNSERGCPESLDGNAEYLRIILLRNDGSTQEVFRGSGFSEENWKKRMEESNRKSHLETVKPEPIEVKCFGVPAEDIRNLTKDSVELRHQQTRVWREYKICHSFEDCPVCGKAMHVLVVKGSTWLALCSKECEDKFAEKQRQLGGVFEAMEYFRKQRGIED